VTVLHSSADLRVCFVVVCKLSQLNVGWRHDLLGG